jgi:hypothetical protein
VSKKIEFLAILYFKSLPEVLYDNFPIISIQHFLTAGEIINFGLINVQDRTGYNLCEYRSYGGETFLVKSYRE